MGWGLLFVSGLCLGFYLLYINGLLMLSAKIAVIFAGYIRKNGEAALQFAGCNGQVKRVLRFHKAGNYEFVYRSEISEGAVTLQILDEKKRELISCMGMNYAAKLEAEEKKRYYMVFRFNNATGKCSVMWN